MIGVIVDNLAFLSKSTSLENLIGLFDTNRAAQDFFKEFLRLVFGYEDLQDLDKLNNVLNYPAIDLGDKKAKICFQITTDSSSTKIQDTLKLFIKKELYKEYDRLVILIIGGKEAYPKTNFNTNSLFSFSKSDDIWDDDNLVQAINNVDNIAKLEEIQKFLEDNLAEIKFPERLFPDDIKTAIEKLSEGMGELLEGVLSDPIAPSNRDGDFIREQKNPLNNLDWETFKSKVRGHWIYNQTIDEFLRDDINRDVRDMYFRVCRGVQKFQQDHEKDLVGIEDVFKSMYNRLPNSYDDGFNNQKVKIVLHNMYLNCDIGKNPDASSK